MAGNRENNMNYGMVIGRCRPKGNFLVRPSDGGNTVLLSGSRTSFLRKRDLVAYDCIEEGPSLDIARRYQKSAPLPKQKKPAGQANKRQRPETGERQPCQC